MVKMSKLPDGIEVIDFKLPVGLGAGVNPEVKVGDVLEQGTPLATSISKKIKRYSVGSYVKLKPGTEVVKYIVKKVDDEVAIGDVLARRKDWLGMHELKSDVPGVITEISESGEMVICIEETKTVIASPMAGTVVGIADSMVELQSEAYQFKGATGWGGCRWGSVVVLETHENHTHLEDWNSTLHGSIVVFQGVLTPAYWYKASTLGVAGIWCDEVPSNYQTWMGPFKGNQPSMVAFSNTGEKASEDLWKWLAKQEGKLCFLLPDTKEMIVIKG